MADLVDRFNGAQQALLSAARAGEETAWAEIDGMAARDIANQAFDDGVRALSRDLLGASGNDRAAEPCARVLPQGLEHEIDTPILEQVARGTKLLDRLASPAEEDALRKRHEPVLKAALASLDEAIAALSAGLEATGRARTHEALARMDWDRMYERNYGALVERFGKKNAERYFLHNAVRSVSENDVRESSATVAISRHHARGTAGAVARHVYGSRQAADAISRTRTRGSGMPDAPSRREDRARDSPHGISRSRYVRAGNRGTLFTKFEVCPAWSTASPQAFVMSSERLVARAGLWSTEIAAPLDSSNAEGFSWACGGKDP